MEALQIQNPEISEDFLRNGGMYYCIGIKEEFGKTSKMGIYLGTSIDDKRIRYFRSILIRTKGINSWDKGKPGLLRFLDYELKGSNLIISGRTQRFAKLSENEKRFYNDLLKKLGL